MSEPLVADRWYPVLRGRPVGRRPVGFRRLCRDLVAWRDDDGRAVVMDRRCPHRGASLAQGRVRDGCIECPYHGFRFEAAGRCVAIPCEGPDARIPAGLDVGVYASAESDGLVWMWAGAGKAAAFAPWCDPLRDDAPAPWPAFDLSWKASLPRVVEGLLDPHHVAFLHRRSSMGTTGERVDPFEAELDGDAIACRGTVGKLAFELLARYPGLVRAHYGPKVVYAYATPIDAENTWLSLQYDLRLRWLGPLRHLVNRVLVAYEKRFVLPEDEAALRDVTPADTGDGTNKLVHADKAVALWYKLHRAEQSGLVGSDDPPSPKKAGLL